MSDRSNALTVGDRREAGEACGLAGVEGAEFGHCDQQGEGGDGRDARDGGQDCETAGQVGVGFDGGEDSGFDRLNLAFDLIETLCVMLPQEG